MNAYRHLGTDRCTGQLGQVGVRASVFAVMSDVGFSLPLAIRIAGSGNRGGMKVSTK